MSRLDLANRFQLRRNPLYVRSPHRIAIPRRAMERREVAIGQNLLCQNPSARRQNLDNFGCARTAARGPHFCSVRFHNPPRLFKADDSGFGIGG